MSVELTTRELQTIDNAARAPAELPLDLSWIDVVQMDDTETIVDYTLLRTGPVAGSKWGRTSYGVATAKTPTERDVISFRGHYTINKSLLRIAQKNNYDIISMNSKMIRSNIQFQVAKLIIQGSDPDWRVNVSGIFDVYEDVDAGLTAGAKWDTATKPLVHVAAGFSDLKANNYAPPYQMIMSSNLEAGMLALNDAGNPDNHEELSKRYLRGGTMYYLDNGTSAYGVGGYKFYPLPPASTTDGNWFMFAKTNQMGESNFYLAQISKGIEITTADRLDDNNELRIDYEWRGTPVFRGATTDGAGSAPYIVGEPDVDLAA